MDIQFIMKNPEGHMFGGSEWVRMGHQISNMRQINVNLTTARRRFRPTALSRTFVRAIGGCAPLVFGVDGVVFDGFFTGLLGPSWWTLRTEFWDATGTRISFGVRSGTIFLSEAESWLYFMHACA